MDPCPSFLLNTIIFPNKMSSNLISCKRRKKETYTYDLITSYDNTPEVIHLFPEARLVRLHLGGQCSSTRTENQCSGHGLGIYDEPRIEPFEGGESWRNSKVRWLAKFIIYFDSSGKNSSKMLFFFCLWTLHGIIISCHLISFYFF